MLNQNNFQTFFFLHKRHTQKTTIISPGGVMGSLCKWHQKERPRIH